MSGNGKEITPDTTGELLGRDAVAKALGWSLDKLEALVRQYPPKGCKINGRWDWTLKAALQWKEDVRRLQEYAAQEESRHPEARRMRPVEPPSVASIRGR